MGWWMDISDELCDLVIVLREEEELVFQIALINSTKFMPSVLKGMSGSEGEEGQARALKGI